MAYLNITWSQLKLYGEKVYMRGSGIRTAIKKRLLRLHPDKVGRPNAMSTDDVARLLIELMEAGDAEGSEEESYWKEKEEAGQKRMKAMEARMKEEKVKAEEEAERLREEVAGLKDALRKAVASKQESGAGKGSVQRSAKLNFVVVGPNPNASGARHVQNRARFAAA